jgi:NTE family protein
MAAVDGSRPPRVGLVLGGGGAAGLAFHAGVTLALHHDLGWDARDADIIVGTSAGSIIGGLLRAGLSAEDLAAWASDATPTANGRKFRALMLRADHLPQRVGLPLPTLPGWGAFGVLTRPSQLRAALTTVLPNGLADHGPRLAMMDRLLTAWPEQSLWISAARVGDGQLTWFGRTRDVAPSGAGRLVDVERPDPAPSPAQAIAASCAIPVLARPVRIGNHRYVDGGVHSPTNADVLAEQDLDVVIVSSPMSHGPDSRGRMPSRRLAQRRLDGEVRKLRARGLRVQVVSPDAPTLGAMGWNMLDRARTTGVMRAAFLGTIGQLDDLSSSLFSRSAGMERGHR